MNHLSLKTRFSSALFIFHVFSLLVVSPRVALAGWQTSALLNETYEAAAKNSKIAAAKSGGFHASYYRVDPHQIVYRRYKDGFLAPRIVLRTGTVFNANSCEAGNGDVHVVWEDWQDGLEVGWAWSNNNGQSFNPFQEISNTGDTKWPLIAPFGADASGEVVMSYWNAKSDNKNLYWRRWNGASWGLLYNMNQNADNEYEVFGMLPLVFRMAPYIGHTERKLMEY